MSCFKNPLCLEKEFSSSLEHTSKKQKQTPKEITGSNHCQVKLQHLEDFKGYNKIIIRRNLKRGICADNDTLCTKDVYKNPFEFLCRYL